MQDRRDKAAAGRFLRRLMKKTRTVPRVIVTDKFRSHGAARREVMPSVEHRQSKYLNNRAEDSRQPTRQRERAMTGFRSVGGAQRFLSAFSGISPHFRPRRHLMTAVAHRAGMNIRFAIWATSPALPTGPPRPDHRPGSQAQPARRAVGQSHTRQRDNAVRAAARGAWAGGPEAGSRSGRRARRGGAGNRREGSRSGRRRRGWPGRRSGRCRRTRRRHGGGRTAVR